MRQAKKYWFYTFLAWTTLYAIDEHGKYHEVSVITSDYDDPQKMEHDLIIKMQKRHRLTTAY